MSVQLVARDGRPYCAVSDIGGTFARHDKGITYNSTSYSQYSPPLLN